MGKLSSSNNHPTEKGLLELHRELAQTWGIDFHRIRALICQLTSSNWSSTSDLIAQNMLSHWNVTRLLQQLQPWLESESGLVRIRVVFHDLFTSVFDCSRLPSESLVTPYEEAAKAGAEAAAATTVLASMARIVNNFPHGPLRHLDHVSATPLTCLKRAFFLTRNYALEGATILFLGDHDLTSLALAQLSPGLAIVIVDSDERILDYINTVSVQHSWTIRTVFADLRIELPRSVKASCDLVFTDPPYTADGVRLFLARGLESLKSTTSARLLFCYGFSERHPGLGLKVQSVLHDLHLVTEAILPHFNRYMGAEAIASSASLYICRPTRRSLPAAQALKVDPRIYTQGKSAEETEIALLPLGVAGVVKRYLAEQADERVILVGDGWPKDMLRDVKTISLRGYLRTMPAFPQSRLSPYAGVVAVNLFPHYNAYLVRVLLISAARQIIISAVDNILDTIYNVKKDDPLRALIESKYHVVARERGNAGQPGMVMLQQIRPVETDAVGWILRFIIDHQQARFVNAWREALIAWGIHQGRRISKKQARVDIDQCRLGMNHAQSYLSELSLDDLRALVVNVVQILETLNKGKPKD